MKQQVFIQLRGEGTVVWRPVQAEPITEDLFRVQGSVPDDEEWEFQPGDIVRCKQHTFSSGESGLVAFARE